MTLLTVRNLSIRAPGQPHLLLDRVNFDLSAGEVLAIIGPNGAGKSTLVGALAGDLSYQGEISILGVSDVANERARQIAILPQLSLLNFPYRVWEVVRLARIPHRSGRKRDAEIIDQALELMDIGFLKNRLYTQLSGGEKQRVQVARVLAQIWDENDAPQGTRVLLLDEPVNALDLGHQRDLMLAIKAFASRGVACVMVLHDINLASRFADKMLALLCSQQIACGAPADVVTEENINRLFSIEADIVNHPETGVPLVMGF